LPNELKRILILTAGFGEGHNSAARGVKEGLAANEAKVEVHDLFAETYGPVNNWARKAYLSLINRAPQTWASLYKWIDARKDFRGNLRFLFMLKNRLSTLLVRFQPDVVVSVYPAYPYLLDELLGNTNRPPFRRVVVVTDSISVNAIWFRCAADFFLVPNIQTAAVLQRAGVLEPIIKVFGFPVTPKFAQIGELRQPPSDQLGRRVLYMVNAGTVDAPELVRRLSELHKITLTVTVGRDERLRSTIESIRARFERQFQIIGWTDQMPRLLLESHLLIGKAGGATVQETIAARCPMIVNQVVPGQEEGNARLIVETGSGVAITSPANVAIAVENAFANDARQWHDWAEKISLLSRPTAALEIARFLLSI
jgi:processive 1,2-diacylglycerol beta-glucosyltransferase